jgi:hypothetical protein
LIFVEIVRVLGQEKDGDEDLEPDEAFIGTPLEKLMFRVNLKHCVWLKWQLINKNQGEM